MSSSDFQQQPSSESQNIRGPSNRNPSSSQISNESSHNSADDQQLNEADKLQQQLLRYAISKQKSTLYQQEITGDILDKLSAFREASLGKTGEELVNLKIQELVFNKLLVLNYSKSEFRLVLAHYHLGQAYLANDCVEQAIEHLSIAMHKNQKLFQDIPNSDLLHTYMQIALSEGFMTQGNYEDAIEMLSCTIQLEESIRKDKKRAQTWQSDGRNVRAMILQAQCYCKQKRFDESIQVIDRVISITKQKIMAKVQYAFCLVEKANILAQMHLPEKYQQAIKYQQDAINILVEQNYSKPEEVAQMYSTLGGYFEEIGNSENALTCIQKVKTLYQQLYSSEDKRVIKARRKIATSLLKSQRFKEAVNELLEIVELEEKVFGQNCIQTARTLKLLGTVYISLEVGDARAYLKRAMNIFASHGNKKQVLQIKEKLKMLMQEGVNAEVDAKVLSQQDL